MRRSSLEAADVARARDGALDETVSPQGLDEPLLPPRPFHVGEQADLRRVLGEEGEDVLERHGLLPELPARVPEDERLVGPAEHVQLDHVDAVGEGGLDRRRSCSAGRARPRLGGRS